MSELTELMNSVSCSQQPLPRAAGPEHDLHISPLFSPCTLTTVVLAGGWGDVTNAGGELAFSLMWGVPGAIAGAAAVTWAVTTSTGTMQAHLPVFSLHTRCSGLTAFQDKSPLSKILTHTPEDIFYFTTVRCWHSDMNVPTASDICR